MNNILLTGTVMHVAKVPGPASAAYNFVRFIGGGVAPWVAGIAGRYYGHSSAFYVGATAVVLGLVMLTTMHRLIMQVDEQRDQELRKSLRSLWIRWATLARTKFEAPVVGHAGAPATCAIKEFDPSWYHRYPPNCGTGSELSRLLPEAICAQPYVLGSATKMRKSSPPFDENSVNAKVEASPSATEFGNLHKKTIIINNNNNVASHSPWRIPHLYRG